MTSSAMRTSIPLFVAVEECVDAAIWQLNLLISIPERAGTHVYPFATHLGPLGDPKVVPKCIVRCVWNSSVEAHLGTSPTLGYAHRVRQGNGIVIGIDVAKSCLSAVK